jgi:hypothetical protein
MERREPELDPAMEALMRAIRERSGADPLIGAKLGSKEILQRLIDAMKTEKGVHIESLLCALGSLAGYSCQANLRGQALAKGLSETAAFQVVETQDGRRYFFGDPLNQALAESQHSLWGLAAGAAVHAGASDLPDIGEIFKHTSSVLGTDAFGRVRADAGHAAGDLPVNYLKALWPKLFPTVRLFCENPLDWTILYSLAVQQAIEMGKGVIAPALALRIVMESAIPMSKVDLGSLKDFRA